MTVSTSANRADYNGNGVTTAFAVPFYFPDPTNLQVLFTVIATGVSTVAVLNSDYTVSGAGVSSGGTVTATVAPASTVKVSILLSLQPVQQTHYVENDPFHAATIEANLDYLTLLAKQEAEQIGRAVSVPVGESGTSVVLPAAASRAGFLLGFGASGELALVAAAAQSAAALALSLLSTAIGAGAALVGSNDAGNYFNGATVEAILQEIANPKGQLQLDGVNVLRYITPALWPAILNYTSATDLYSQLQPAFTAESNLVFPDGLFNTGTKLVPRTDAKVRAINRRKTQLHGLGAITAIEFPTLTVDAVVENIYFTGSVAGGTGIAVANTAGTFHDYLIRVEIKNCDFAWELAYGINADLIYGDIHHNTFGYYGTVGAKPAPGASTHVGIRAYQVTGNPPNHTRIWKNMFACGSLTQAGLDVSGPVSLEIGPKNDFSFGGKQISITNAALVEIKGNWFEGNVATNDIISLGGMSSQASVELNNFVNNTADRHVTYSSTEFGAVIARNVWALPTGAGYPIYDNSTTLRTLPGNGVIAWYSNVVTGGNAANKCVTGTEFRGGATSPRLAAACITTTPGTISGSNDPGASISFNATGDVSVTGSHPFASSAAKVVATATANNPGYEVRAQVINASQVRVSVQTAAGAPVDGTFSLVVLGS